MGVVQDIISLLTEIRDGSTGSNSGISGLDLKIQQLIDKLTAFQYLETEFSQTIGTSPSLIIGEETEALDREISIRNAGNHIAFLSNSSTPSISSPWRLPPNFLFSGVEGMEAIYGVAAGETELGVSIKLRLSPPPPPPNNPIQQLYDPVLHETEPPFPWQPSINLADYFSDADPADTITFEFLSFEPWNPGAGTTYTFDPSGLVSLTLLTYDNGVLFFRASSSDGTFIDAMLSYDANSIG